MRYKNESNRYFIDKTLDTLVTVLLGGMLIIACCDLLIEEEPKPIIQISHKVNVTNMEKQ